MNKIKEAISEPVVPKETYDQLHIDYVNRGAEIDIGNLALRAMAKANLQLENELKAKDEKIKNLKKLLKIVSEAAVDMGRYAGVSKTVLQKYIATIKQALKGE